MVANYVQLKLSCIRGPLEVWAKHVSELLTSYPVFIINSCPLCIVNGRSSLFPHMYIQSDGTFATLAFPDSLHSCEKEWIKLKGFKNKKNI